MKTRLHIVHGEVSKVVKRAVDAILAATRRHPAEAAANALVAVLLAKVSCHLHDDDTFAAAKDLESVFGRIAESYQEKAPSSGQLN